MSQRAFRYLTFFYIPELVGFQTMVILDPYGMTFDAVVVFGLVSQLFLKSCSSYCEFSKIPAQKFEEFLP